MGFNMEKKMKEQDVEFLEYLDARIAQRQRELTDVPKFSSHYGRLEFLLKELKAVRAKFSAIDKRSA